MKRWEVLAAIVAAYPSDPVVVTLGGTAREMAAFHRAPNHLYVLDSMGLPPAIGLGLALGLDQSRFARTVVIEGDGSLLMGFSTLATIGLLKPEKLVLIVLDNGVYAATGAQPTAASSVDFVAAARACGIDGREVADLDGLRTALDWSRETAGPLLIRARIDPDQARTPFLLEDPVLLGATFAKWLAENRG